MTANAPPPTDDSCRICTIQLETFRYRRAGWFRPFREVPATGIRLSAVAMRIDSSAGHARSAMRRGCLRFRKNVLKRRSPLFKRLDASVFNRARNSLQTPEELDRGRSLAQRVAERELVAPAFASLLDIRP